MKTRNCDYCGKSYAYKRANSRFCSASCRVGFSQRGSDWNRRMLDIRQWLNWMMNQCREREGFVTTEMLTEISAVQRHVIALERVALDNVECSQVESKTARLR